MAIEYSFTEITRFLPDYSSAAGFNDKGQIVGSFEDGPFLLGYVYRNGQFETADSGADATFLTDINNLGQISAYVLDSFDAFAFVLDSDGTPIEVPFQGGSTFALGINDAGQVTVIGTLPCGCS